VSLSGIPASRPRTVTLPFGKTAPVLRELLDALPGRPSFIYERSSTRTRRVEQIYVGYGETVHNTPGEGEFSDLRARIANSRELPEAPSAMLAFLSYEALRDKSTPGGNEPSPRYILLQPAFLLELNYREGLARLSGDYESILALVNAALQSNLQGASQACVLDDSLDTLMRWTVRPPRNEFFKAVREVQQAIRAGGELEGACLSVELEAQADIDPLACYLILREINPSTCMFFLEQHAFALWGATSLPLMQVRSGRIVVETDGATRRLGPAASAQWSPTQKEMAEYDLVVSALRDDLVGIVEPASFAFTKERELRTYYNLGHIFAEAAADLAPGVDAVDALRSLAPHGAAAGYRKAAALKLIDQIDVEPRGPYSGAIGVFDVHGDADAACVIRSSWKVGGTLRTRAGAKIVADSDPAAEYEESILKTLPLRKTIEHVLSRAERARN
jgi:anthranilate synthase component 1